MVGTMASTWARQATSGTTPPKRACSSTLLADRVGQQDLRPRTSPTPVSSQDVSMPRTSGPSFTSPGYPRRVRPPAAGEPGPGRRPTLAGRRRPRACGSSRLGWPRARIRLRHRVSGPRHCRLATSSSSRPAPLCRAASVSARQQLAAEAVSLGGRGHRDGHDLGVAAAGLRRAAEPGVPEQLGRPGGALRHQVDPVRAQGQLGPERLRRSTDRPGRAAAPAPRTGAMSHHRIGRRRHDRTGFGGPGTTASGRRR